MKAIQVAAAVATVITLSACGGGGKDGTPSASRSSTSSASSSSSSSSPTSAAPQEYGTVLALKDAAVGSGYVCPNWQEDNRVKGAAQSGQCNDDDVFMIFTSTSSRDEVVDFLKGLGGASLLVGPNWVINSDDATRMQASMGGTVVTS